MAGNIFVSYRRDDSKHAAGRLVDRLQSEFDKDQLFLDVDNIELGLDFVEVINERVAACDIMLVVIGPQWHSASTAAGRRLDDPKDFVRLEIEAALERNIRVIPILVDGAEPPRTEDLPEALAPLANRQATRLSHESFTHDAAALTTALARIVGHPATRKDSSRPAQDEEPGATETEARDRSFAALPPLDPDAHDRSNATGEQTEQAAETTGPMRRIVPFMIAALGLYAAMFVLATVSGFGLRMGFVSLALVYAAFLAACFMPISPPWQMPKALFAAAIAFAVHLFLGVFV